MLGLFCQSQNQEVKPGSGPVPVSRPFEVNMEEVSASQTLEVVQMLPPETSAFTALSKWEDLENCPCSPRALPTASGGWACPDSLGTCLASRKVTIALYGDSAVPSAGGPTWKALGLKRLDM